MIETVLYALLIMGLRIIDVSLGTIRTIITVQGKKYKAGMIGFIEVTIWVAAISTVLSQLNNWVNILAYSGGFGLGTVIGISIEQYLGSGYVWIHIISLNYPDVISDALRENKFGVTMLPGEGASGGVTVLMVMIPRKRQKEVIGIIDSIDHKAFVSIHPSIPHKGGYIHNMRK
ncbi:MAG: DUF5698 domain-containing protein [Ignavibacteria bacterium]|nr:DUF5698 domain-containing protein [Ignavibacteria bacterium]